MIGCPFPLSPRTTNPINTDSNMSSETKIELRKGLRYLFRNKRGYLWSGRVTEVSKTSVRIMPDNGTEHWRPLSEFEQGAWPIESENTIVEIL